MALSIDGFVVVSISYLLVDHISDWRGAVALGWTLMARQRDGVEFSVDLDIKGLNLGAHGDELHAAVVDGVHRVNRSCANKEARCESSAVRGGYVYFCTWAYVASVCPLSLSLFVCVRVYVFA